MDLSKALAISARGMDAQTTRLRAMAETLAGQDTADDTPGADPYRSKTTTFEQNMDEAAGPETMQVKQVATDSSELGKRHDPSHPAADAQGYVHTPHVDNFVEVMDMREAQRSLGANLNVMQLMRSMLTRTIELLK